MIKFFFITLLSIFVTIYLNGQSLTPKLSGEKWGYVNLEGNFIIKPEYDYAKPLDSAGYAIVAKSGSPIKTRTADNSGWDERIDTLYLINNTGETIIRTLVSETRSGYAKNFSLQKEISKETVDARIRFLFDGAYEINIPKKDEYSVHFKDSIFVFVKGIKVLSAKAFNDKTESYNLEGASTYQSHSSGIILYYCENVNSISGPIIKKLVGINMQGKIIFQVPNTSYGYGVFFNNYSIFSSNKEGNGWGRYLGYIDSKGVIVIQPKYNFLTNFSEGKAVAGYFYDFQKDTPGFKCFIIDSTGKELAPIPELSLTPLQDYFSSSLYKNILKYPGYTEVHNPIFKNGIISFDWGNSKICFDTNGKKTMCN